MVLKSQLPKVDIPSQDLPSFILDRLKTHGDQVVLVDAETRKDRYTAIEAYNAASSIASGLQAGGFKKGDVALVAVPNCPDYVIFMLGVLRAGGTVSGVNIMYTEHEIADRIDDCRPKVALVHRSYMPVFRKGMEKCPGVLKKVFIASSCPKCQFTSDRRPFSDLTQFSARNPSYQFRVPNIIPKEDICFLPYSSGTTGRPKGVLQTHYNIVSLITLTEAGNFISSQVGDGILAVLPFYHAFGQTVSIKGLRDGCTIITMMKFDPHLYLQSIQDFKVSVFHLLRVGKSSMSAGPGDGIIAVLPFYHVAGQTVSIKGLRDGCTIVTMRIFRKQLYLIFIQECKATGVLLGDGAGKFISPQLGDGILAVLPFYHAFGQTVSIMGLRDGCTIITMSKFDPHLYLQSIQDFKVWLLGVVPPMMLFLARDPMVVKYDISSLRVVLVGAAPAGKELINDFKKRHPYVVAVAQAYGMTEGAAASHITPPVDNVPPGSCGILMANWEAKILDIKTGKELGIGEDGEICIRSECVMKGYLNRNEETAKTIDKDGWLHTGDIGHYDEDGFFFVVDRLKELIKVKGFQVPPAELEDILFGHPGILDTAVIGVADDASGELPKAFIVPKQGVNLSKDEIFTFVEKQVAPYKRLKFIEFVSEIPKSPTGKILRRELRDKERNKTNRAKL